MHSVERMLHLGVVAEAGQVFCTQEQVAHVGVSVHVVHVVDVAVLDSVAHAALPTGVAVCGVPFLCGHSPKPCHRRHTKRIFFRRVTMRYVEINLSQAKRTTCKDGKIQYPSKFTVFDVCRKTQQHVLATTSTARPCTMPVMSLMRASSVMRRYA